MEKSVNNPEMAESTKMVKISEKSYNRLVKFGVAGESVNKALERALDLAEKVKDKK
jgi:hypothetical protein